MIEKALKNMKKIEKNALSKEISFFLSLGMLPE
jgi:hypothetical protein